MGMIDQMASGMAQGGGGSPIDQMAKGQMRNATPYVQDGKLVVPEGISEGEVLSFLEQRFAIEAEDSFEGPGLFLPEELKEGNREKAISRVMKESTGGRE